MPQGILSPPGLHPDPASAAPPVIPRHAHHAAVTLRILSQNLYGAEEHEPQRRAAAFTAALEQLLNARKAELSRWQTRLTHLTAASLAAQIVCARLYR